VKPVVTRERAQRDIDEAIAYYFEEGGADLALGFIDALEAAYRRIGTSPQSGSPRYAHELDLPGLRFWPLRRFPYLIFYLDRSDQLDIWRVLHGQRDIPSWLQESA
jgi:toxin ParE1/3/4